MKKSIVCAPAGTALFRDVRCWHGGTANRSDRPRAMTNAHYYAPWFRSGLSPCVPRAHLENMSPRARQLCRYIIEDS